MPYDNRNYLFSDYDLTGALRANQEKIRERVDSIPKDQFLATSHDDLVQHIVSSSEITPVTVHEDRISATEPRECKIDVSHDSRRNFFHDSGQPIMVDGFEVVVELPFTGDHNILKSKPSSYSSVFPRAVIVEPRGDVPGKLVMSYRQPHDEDPSRMKANLDSELNTIRKYVSWTTQDVNKHNQELPLIVERVVDARTERLKKESSITDILGIPLQQKEGTPSFAPIKVKKKIVKPLPPAPKEGYKSEPGISEQDYTNILDLIRHSGTSFEKTPKTYIVHDEEELRDIMLSHLNAVYEGGATGETFNKSGKTDILISEDGRNAFIGECKIWRGQKALSESIDQLLGYLTWRDCKTALIVFNKNNKDFSKILETVVPTVEAHPNFIFNDGQQDENEWHFTMQSVDDENRQVRIRIMVFNLYCLE